MTSTYLITNHQLIISHNKSIKHTFSFARDKLPCVSLQKRSLTSATLVCQVSRTRTYSCMLQKNKTIKLHISNAIQTDRTKLKKSIHIYTRTDTNKLNAYRSFYLRSDEKNLINIGNPDQ